MMNPNKPQDPKQSKVADPSHKDPAHRDQRAPGQQQQEAPHKGATSRQQADDTPPTRQAR